MRFWRVTVPLLSPTIFFAVVVGSIFAFQTFGQIDLLTRGGPQNKTNVLTFAGDLWQRTFDVVAADYPDVQTFIVLGYKDFEYYIWAGLFAPKGTPTPVINRLRDAGEELPGCAWLVSPWTDLTMSGETLATKDAVDPIIHENYLGELADAYLPAGTDRKDPQVSPLYADLKGLPPTLIQVGSAETLLADATRFAAAAGGADVRVTLEIWPHMIHAWHLWNAHLEPGRRALANAGTFIRECL